MMKNTLMGVVSVLALAAAFWLVTHAVLDISAYSTIWNKKPYTAAKLHLGGSK